MRQYGNVCCCEQDVMQPVMAALVLVLRTANHAVNDTIVTVAYVNVRTSCF